MLDLIRTLTQVEHVRKRCLDFSGRPASQYKGYLGPASVEHPDTPRAPDAVDITVVCSRLAVTLHPTRHPLAYRSRAASAARVCWPSTRVSRLVSVYPRHNNYYHPLPGRLNRSRVLLTLSDPSPALSTLGKLAAVEKLSIP